MAKKLILKAKLAHKKDVIPFLSQRLALIVYTNQQLKLKLEYNQFFIPYILSHGRRQYNEKRNNQSKLLAKSLANELGIPMLKQASNKYYTVFQLYPNREERKKNLKGVFYIEDLLKLQNGSTVLLVDGVIAISSVRISKNYPGG